MFPHCSNICLDRCHLSGGDIPIDLSKLSFVVKRDCFVYSRLPLVVSRLHSPSESSRPFQLCTGYIFLHYKPSSTINPFYSLYNELIIMEEEITCNNYSKHLISEEGKCSFCGILPKQSRHIPTFTHGDCIKHKLFVCKTCYSHYNRHKTLWRNEDTRKSPYMDRFRALHGINVVKGSQPFQSLVEHESTTKPSQSQYPPIPSPILSNNDNVDSTGNIRVHTVSVLGQKCTDSGSQVVIHPTTDPEVPLAYARQDNAREALLDLHEAIRTLDGLELQRWIIHETDVSDTTSLLHQCRTLVRARPNYKRHKSAIHRLSRVLDAYHAYKDGDIDANIIVLEKFATCISLALAIPPKYHVSPSTFGESTTRKTKSAAALRSLINDGRLRQTASILSDEIEHINADGSAVPSADVPTPEQAQDLFPGSDGLDHTGFADYIQRFDGIDDANAPSSDAYVASLRRLASSSSSGPDDVLPSTLKALIRDNEPVPIAQDLVAFLRDCVKHGFCPRIWRNSHLTVIPKKGGGHRPIQSPSALYRWMVSTVVRTIVSEVGEETLVGTHQHGITTEGTVVVASSLQALQKDDGDTPVLCLVSDIKAAFPSLNRHLIRANILHLPVAAELKQFLLSLYDDNEVFYPYKGNTHLITDVRGTKQECSASALLFSINMRPLVDRIGGFREFDRPVVELETCHIDAPPNPAYLDDLYIISSSLQRIDEAFVALTDHNAESKTGLCLNRDKTLLVVLNQGRVLGLSLWGTIPPGATASRTRL